MTHPSQWPLGSRIAVGRGTATTLPDIDFETYSEAGWIWQAAPTPKNPEAGKWLKPRGASKQKNGLGIVGAAVYAQHESTEVLSLSYNLKAGAGIQRWRPGYAPPQDLFAYIARGGLLAAWNSGFEWWIWNYCATRRYGWPPLPIFQLRCDMGKARAFAMPGALALAGEVLRLEVQKDEGGGAALDRYSKPRNPTLTDRRRRIRPEEEPDKAETLYRYNDIDIISEAEASSRVPDLEGEELAYWMLDQLINRRGVHVDRDSLYGCANIVEQCLERFNGEMHKLTNGAVERTSQLDRLKGWLAQWGVHMGDGRGTMDEEAITAMLKRLQPHPAGSIYPPRRALELRQLAGSAAVKKVFTMVNMLTPASQLHDLYDYHGARTGRPVGRDAQPTNLPKAGPPVYRCGYHGKLKLGHGCGKYHGTHVKQCPWCNTPVLLAQKQASWNVAAVEDALTVIRTSSIDAVQMHFGDAMLTVSGCVRGLFTASPGYEFIASDLSAIESVVTAALAGEDWRMEMFNSHGKNYEMSAAKISGIPFEEMMAHAGYTDLTIPEWWLQPQTGEHHPRRQDLGKVSELASGFGGWIAAWVKFGADEFMSEEEIKRGILAWREASPSIVYFWGGQERREGYFIIPERFGLEGMAMNAVENPGVTYHVKRRDGSESGVKYIYGGREDDILYCYVPGDVHPMYYHRPRLSASDRAYGGPLQLTFEGYNSNAAKGATGWMRMKLYGGLQCENVVQRTARNLQRRAGLNLENAGYEMRLHVYDENVVQVPIGVGSVEDMERTMGTPVEWAVYKGKPWPIKVAGGWRGVRYRKG